MQRVLIIAVVVALILGAAGYLAWRHLENLSNQVTDLSQQVDELGAKAETAEARATEAEARAERAQNAAGEAADRAVEAVEREQESGSGIDSNVMSTMGLGKSSPLVEGTDPESRQRNRRVELAIVLSEGEYEAIQPDGEEEPI